MSSVDLHVIQENRSWCRGKGGKIKERKKVDLFYSSYSLKLFHYAASEVC